MVANDTVVAAASQTAFSDFCLGMYVLVDELWDRVGAWYRRPGPAPACSDSELLTMVLVGECRGWDLETEAVACWRERRDLFPVVDRRPPPELANYYLRPYVVALREAVRRDAVREKASETHAAS